VILIKQQRPIFPSTNRKIAQPRIIIRCTPESDGINVVLILRQQMKKGFIPLRLLLQQRFDQLIDFIAL
jgi:hypothetical protein